MSYQTALDALGKMTRVIKAFEDAEVVLKTLTGIEQNEKELRAAADKARAELESVNRELAEAKDLVTAARKAAAKVKEDAQAKADQVAAAAQAAAAEIEAQTVNAVNGLRDELAATQEAVRAAQAEHAEAVAQLADVQSKLAEARAKIASMLE